MPDLALINRLKSDELMLRYARKVNRDGQAKPTSVLDFLGELRALAFGLANGGYQTMAGAQGLPVHAREQLGAALLDCPVFTWTEEMRTLARSYAVPDHAISAMSFPHDAMWWSFSVRVVVHEGAVDGLLICKSSWLRQRVNVTLDWDGWVVIAIGENHDSTEARVWLRATTPYGTNTKDSDEMRTLVGCSALMTSKFINLDRQRASDINPKWHGRRIGDPSSINVITLRSEVREAVAVERGQGPSWKQRWLVRGHMRAQWYPASGQHHLIWIAPYLKGPDDAPLKMPVYSVAR